ncbi:MAG TPA: hypothetical protein V6C58_24540 [Allocoleopsis sp.]
MSFRPVREYLKDRLLEVDSDFEPYDEAFENDNLGDNNFDKRFQIFYQVDGATVSNQLTTQDEVTARVTLFFNGSRDSQEEFDSSMDIANVYRIQCLKVDKLRPYTHLKRVVCTSIVPEPLDTNDNMIKIILTFRISMIFGLGVNLDC